MIMDSRERKYELKREKKTESFFIMTSYLNEVYLNEE